MGGMGEVWAADQCATGLRVALKTLRPDVGMHAEVVQRFKREAQLLGRVRSDRVARVVDFLEDARWGVVLVTEFVEGRSLADAPELEPLSVERAVELGIEIVLALRELHKARIVHRDLKPGNVILQPVEDGRSRAVLVDLGVSRALCCGDDEPSSDALTDITRTSIVLGTVGFMAPEQILGPRDVTAAADLYSLGAMLYRMVSGRNVFGGLSRIEQLHAKLLEDAPRLETARADTLARGFEAVVSRALERDPTLRYGSADEMAAALSALRGNARSAPASAPATARTGRRGTYSLLATIAAIAVSVSVCAAAAFVSWTEAAPSQSAAQLSRAPQDRASGWAATEPPAPGPLCLPTDAAPGSSPPKDHPAPLTTGAGPTGAHRDARARDEDLMRAIRRAVAEDASRALVVPSPDDLPLTWGHPSTPPRPVLAAASR